MPLKCLQFFLIGHTMKNPLCITLFTVSLNPLISNKILEIRSQTLIVATLKIHYVVRFFSL